jgi:hypothetical protein
MYLQFLINMPHYVPFPAPGPPITKITFGAPSTLTFGTSTLAPITP